MNDRAAKAFQEMLDISTDMNMAMLCAGEEILVSDFPEHLNAIMLGKAKELTVLGNAKASDMNSAPLTQLVVDTNLGMVFLVREPAADGMSILATGKKDSRIGLVFYDMKTCIRDAQEEDTEAVEE